MEVLIGLLVSPFGMLPDRDRQCARHRFTNSGSLAYSEALVALRSLSGEGSCTQAEIGFALGAGAHMGRVECEPNEGETADKIANDSRDLVPDQIVHDREVATEHQA